MSKQETRGKFVDCQICGGTMGWFDEDEGIPADIHSDPRDCIKDLAERLKGLEDWRWGR